MRANHPAGLLLLAGFCLLGAATCAEPKPETGGRLDTEPSPTLDAGDPGEPSPLIRFRDQSGAEISFDQVEIASPSRAFGLKGMSTPDLALYESKDGARHWTKVGSVDAHGGILVFAADELWSLSGIPVGSTMGRSTDGGRTWTRLDPGIRALWGDVPVSLNGLTQVRSTGSVFSVGQAEFSRALVRSDDAGAHWTRIDVPENPSFALGTGDHLFVFAEVWPAGGIFRLSGEQAVDLAENLPSGFHPNAYNAAVAGDVLTLIGQDSSMLATADGGQTFVRFTLESPDASQPFAFRGGLATSNTAGYATYHDSGPNRVSLRRTEDGGATWSVLMEDTVPSTSASTRYRTDGEGNVYVLLYEFKDAPHATVSGVYALGR